MDTVGVSGTLIEVNEGGLVRVKGPALFVVAQGLLYGLGIEFKAGCKVKVPKGRVIVFKALKNTVIKGMVGDGGELGVADPSEEVLDRWINLVNRILNVVKQRLKKNERTKILVLGPVDSGKTTITTFILNAALRQGLRVSVLDLDVGQADIGPPTTIALASPDKPVLSLRDLTPDSLSFIGTIAPEGYEWRIISSALKLCFEAEGKTDLILINTDGWVTGFKAVCYKINLVRTLRPQIIIVMLKDSSLRGLVSSLRKLQETMEIIEAPTPPAIHRRSREERRYLRAQNYYHYFKDSKIRVISLADVLLLDTPLLGGYRLPMEMLESLGDNKILHAELHGNRLLLVTEKKCSTICSLNSIIEKIKKDYGVEKVKILSKGYFTGLLVGLLDEKFVERGLGLIQDFNFMENVIKIKTSYRGPVKGIMFSRIRLKEDYTESIS
ncbi:MAG: hypothetical protein DRJ47_06425 [Thermoprotei archaeon]|nr:MAG: hypothetical protein DRJ47_06425 [Thermoprotei archaeon]